MKKHKPLKIVFSAIGIILALVIAFACCFLIYASATALKVQERESADISGSVSAEINANEPLTLLTWNTGYCALDERQDCYWDGGTGIDGESEETVKENLEALTAQIKELNPDVFSCRSLMRIQKGLITSMSRNPLKRFSQRMNTAAALR